MVGKDEGTIVSNYDQILGFSNFSSSFAVNAI
jgi:hypothetical protein